jgi:hypothetical protein
MSDESTQPTRRSGASRLAYCIACGCHDLAACYDDNAGGPCHWLAVDREAKLGVCSACPDAIERWNAGDRSIAVPVRATDH